MPLVWKETYLKAGGRAITNVLQAPGHLSKKPEVDMLPLVPSPLVLA